MKNLISNTSFGKKIESKLLLGDIDYKEYFILRCNYDLFLLKVLEIWMFVPCKLVDGVWVVMKTPDEKEQWFRDTYDNGWWCDFIKYKIEYQEAKERCLFEGFSCIGEKGIYILRNIPNSWYIEIGFKNKCKYYQFEVIEDLVKYKPEITQTVIKQIGL